MNKLPIALLCLLCAASCFGQTYRRPEEQPKHHRHPLFCPPCPAVFPPSQPQQGGQSFGQCPCVKPPGSASCATYDRRLQAATLEEALYSFPDLGARGLGAYGKPLFDASKEAQSLQQKGPTMSFAGPVQPQVQQFSASAAVPEADVAQTSGALPPPVPFSGGEYSCNSPACKACMLKVVNGFIDAASTSPDQSTIAQFLTRQKQLQVEAGGVVCPGTIQPMMMQEPAVKMAGAASVQPVPTDVIAQIVKAIQPDGSRLQRRSTTDEEEQIHSEAETSQKRDEQMRFNRQSSTRSKRQSAAPSSKDLIGTATKLGCDYQRGTPIGDSNFIGLCNICWQWRKLPDKYFPSYLNEVSCDSKDDQCLAGWGKCRPVLRSVNVLVNRATADKPEWQQESIFTVAACECQVEIGSPLHTFVTR